MNDEDWKKVAERHLGKHVEYVNGWADCEERIKKLLDDSSRICKCTPTCVTDVNIVAFVIEELGINIIDLIDGREETK